MHQSSKNQFLQTTLAGLAMDRRSTCFLGERVLQCYSLSRRASTSWLYYFRNQLVLDNLVIELLKVTRFLGERVLGGYIISETSWYSIIMLASYFK